MTAGKRRLALTLLTLMYGFGFIDRVVIALVAQDMQSDLHLSDLQLGLLGGTAFALVNVVVAVPMARIAERRRRSRVVTLSLAFGSLCATVCAAAGSLLQLLPLRMGMAVGSAGTEAPAHSMISDMYGPERRISALSLFMLGIPVASIVGSYVGGALAQAYGWRASFLAFGLGGLLLALASLLVLPEPPRATAGADRAPSVFAVARTLFADRSFRWVLAGAALVSLGSFGLNGFLPLFLIRDHGLDAGQAGLAFGAISGGASAVGTLAGGYAIERLVRREPAWLAAGPATVLVIGIPILVAGILQQRLVLALPLIFLGCCTLYTLMGPAITLAHGLLDSRSRATGSALCMLTMHLIGQGFGPPLVGLASDHLAAWAFGSADYTTTCAGIVAHPACARAAAMGLRYAITGFALIYLIAAAALFMGARAIRSRR